MPDQHDDTTPFDSSLDDAHRALRDVLDEAELRVQRGHYPDAELRQRIERELTTWLQLAVDRRRWLDERAG